MDEGYLKDSKGRKVSFDNVFLFLTTNLGSQKQEVGFTTSTIKANEELEEFLGVEFVNRIGKSYQFQPLKEESIKKIMSQKLSVLTKAFRKKNINVKISQKIVEKMIEKTNYEKYGARQVDKIIDSMVTPVIVDAWYKGEKEITV